MILISLMLPALLGSEASAASALNDTTIVKEQASTQQGPELLSKKEAKGVLNTFVNNYKNWSKCAIEGKLSTDKLPISPSVKIYMEKGKVFMMSVKAPLIGEVARIEMDKDSLTVVNKMKRTFCRVGTDHLDQAYPSLLTDMQSMMLGRVTVMGRGALSKKDVEEIDVYVDGQSDVYMVVPKEKYQPELFRYGYEVYPEGEVKTLVIEMQGTNNMATAQYGYGGSADNRKTVIDFELKFNNKSYGASLSLNAPQWGGKGFDRFEPTSRYIRVGLTQVLKFK